MITEEQYLQLQARGLACAQERRQMRHFERRVFAVTELASMLFHGSREYSRTEIEDRLMLACGLRGDGSS